MHKESQIRSEDIGIAAMEGLTADLAQDYAITGGFGQRVNTPVLSGRLWRCEISGGITAIGHDYRCLRDITLSETPRNALLVIVQLDGEAAMTLAGQAVLIPQHSCTLINLTDDAPCTGQVREAARSRAVGFLILRDKVEAPPDPAFARLMAFDGGPVRRLPADARLMEIAESALAQDHDGLIAQLHIESRMLALVVRIVELIGDEAPLASPLALAVRDALGVRLADPPTIAALARQMGVGQSRLRAEFRAAFGTTPVAWLREARLQKAQALLRAGGTNVTGVAYTLGFDTPQNFATAYRRRFGNPPGTDLARVPPR